MYSWTRLLLTFFLLSLGYEMAHAQVVIPPENEGDIDTLFGQFLYPENYEKALELMLQSEKDNRPSLMDYYGLQALNWAKEKEDSTRIRAVLTQLAFKIEDRGEYAKADSLFDIALAFSSSNKERANTYLDKIGPALRVSDYIIMSEYLALAREEIGDDTLSPVMAMYYFNKGLYHFEAEQDFVATLIAYESAKKGTLREPAFINMVNANLSNIYLHVELYDKAKELVQEEINIAVQTEDVYGELFGLYSLGYIAMELEEYEELKEISDQIFSLNEKQGISIAFGYAYFLLGEYYLAENQLDAAKATFQQGVNYCERKQEEKELIDCLGGMMRTYVKEGKYQEAIEYGERAMSLQYRPDHNIEEQLAYAYQQNGRHAEAYELLKTFMEENNSDELKRTNILLTTRLLENRFKQDQKEVELVYENNLNKQQLQLVLSTFGLTVLAALLTLYLQVRSRRKLKKLNNSLIESNQSLTQFAYITSHDLKEPVRNITSFSNLLTRRLSQKENTSDEKDFLKFITSNAIVLKEIIDSLQIFTNISFGKIEKEKVELDAVFETLESSLQQTIEEKNGILCFQNPDEIKEILFSRSMLILVLQNLILNGFKYNQSLQPKVEVRLSKQSGKTLFEVIDNGDGIDEEYHEKIFTPFKTLKNKSLTQSSGLGLSICKSILERYNGSIWVNSDGKSGSTFFVLI